MSNGIARLGDQVEGTCRAGGDDHPRHFIGHWTTCSGTFFADGIGVIRVGDQGVTDCGHTFHASTGSSIGKDQGLAIHRVGDEVIVDQGGEGVTVSGSTICVCD